MKKLNETWGDRGNCIRLQQHIGPTVLSDLIFSSRELPGTLSIEVKKVTEKLANAGTDWEFLLPRHLSFVSDFSVTTASYEPIKHQLERQVLLCRRMGWTPVVLLYVVHPEGHGKPTRFLFSSEKLYAFWKKGHPVLPAELYEDFHEWQMAAKVFKDKRWIRTTQN